MTALSVGEVADYLNLTNADNHDKLEQRVKAAQSAIEKRVGLMEPTTITARVSASGTLRLPFYQRNRPTFPATAITSITPVGGTAVSIVDLTVDDINVVRGASFTGTYDVVYTAGYDPLPDDLAEALCELTRHLWKPQRGGTQRPGAQPSEQLSNSLPASATTLPFRVEQLIDDYRPNGFA